MEVGKGQKYLKIFEHPFMNLDQEWNKTTLTITVMNIYWCIYSYIYRHYQHTAITRTQSWLAVPLYHYYQRYTAQGRHREK